MRREYEQAVRVLRQCCDDLGLEFVVQSPRALIGALKDEQVDPTVVARFGNVLSSGYCERMLALFINHTAPDVVRQRQLDMLMQEGMVAQEKAVEIQEVLWAMVGWTYSAPPAQEEPVSEQPQGNPTQPDDCSHSSPASQPQPVIPDGPLFRNLDALEEMPAEPEKVKRSGHWIEKCARALAGMAVFAGLCMGIGWGGEYVLWPNARAEPRMRWPYMLMFVLFLIAAYVAYEGLASSVLHAGRVKKSVPGVLGFVLCGACLYAGVRVWEVGRTYGSGWEGIPWPLLVSAAAMAYPLVRLLTHLKRA